MGLEAMTPGWHAYGRPSSTGFPQAIIVGTMVRHGRRRICDISLKRVHRGHTLTAGRMHGSHRPCGFWLWLDRCSSKSEDVALRGSYV